MRKVKLLGVMVLALFAVGAFTASSAFAVEDPFEKPEILVLAGTVEELKGVLTGTNPELIQLSNANTIKATKAELLLNQLGKPECKPLEGSTTDFNLCIDVPLHFTGVKQGAVACRSENNTGGKDPVETVLTLLNLHIGAELTAAKVLLPIIFAAILGTNLEEEVKFNCGTLKSAVKGLGKGPGVINCLLLPGLLENTKKIEILCKVDATTHDAEVGTCNILCLDFGVLGILASLNGTAFEHAWELIHLEGELNKDIFIDD